jgi:hypothetical protein
MDTDSERYFVAGICLPSLKNAQNEDGGWGFRPGLHSRAEPTCWALLALLHSSEPAAGDVIARGFHFLCAGQHADGSWSSTPEEKTGCWVTALACWTLLAAKDCAHAVAAGLRWVCDDWPQDSTSWRRFLAQFSREREEVAMNNGYRGWGWTPGTSSWVEPTACALLALEQVPEHLRPNAAKHRRQLAEAMLYDRMCPGGGWNCGNPHVYGVAGEPLVVPTALALLALRAHRQRPENAASLHWLERVIPSVQGSGSLALAKICLDAYGYSWPDQAPKFADLYHRNLLENVQVTSWICLALHQPAWLARVL